MVANCRSRRHWARTVDSREFDDVIPNASMKSDVESKTAEKDMHLCGQLPFATVTFHWLRAVSCGR